MNDTKKLLLAFAAALDKNAIALGASVEAEEFSNDDEKAEYVWTTAAASATTLLISKAIRDAVKGLPADTGQDHVCWQFDLEGKCFTCRRHWRASPGRH